MLAFWIDFRFGGILQEIDSKITAGESSNDKEFLRPGWLMQITVWHLSIVLKREAANYSLFTTW